MKFSPRKAALAGATAIALSASALTAAPAFAADANPAASAPLSSEAKELFGSSSNDNAQPSKQAEPGKATENKDSAFNFKKFNDILKAISGVVGVASTIFAFLKSLKLV
ncbi:hypothetical protein [Corynebacterium sp.]|uniref:hypothetical protein n=1 Tax=Corynebacterium sp. TaxID=1720 RepID=UPI0027BAD463|nr:hypothetical protein [Corynebacterium sp.]